MILKWCRSSNCCESNQNVRFDKHSTLPSASLISDQSDHERRDEVSMTRVRAVSDDFLFSTGVIDSDFTQPPIRRVLSDSMVLQNQRFTHEYDFLEEEVIYPNPVAMPQLIEIMPSIILGDHVHCRVGEAGAPNDELTDDSISSSQRGLRLSSLSEPNASPPVVGASRESEFSYEKWLICDPDFKGGVDSLLTDGQTGEFVAH